MQTGKKTESMYELFEKRRNYPRLELQLPVTITGAGGTSFTGTIYDLSPDGMQLRYLVKDGIHLFQDKDTGIKDIKSLKCGLQFDLPYDATVVQVMLEAYPIYLRAQNEDTLSAGMYFSKNNKPSETKKVNDFLFYKLEASYDELEHLKDRIAEAETKKALPQDTTQPETPETGAGVSITPVNQILTTRNSNSDLEQFNHLLIQVLSELKVISEMTRATNERIQLIEQQIAKKTDSV